MDQYRNLADDRLIWGCIYCREEDITRDHIPSKILLDKPYPENLPVVGACFSCNNGFSLDEEYLACLIEVLIAKTSEPSKLAREKIADILKNNEKLRKQLELIRNYNEPLKKMKRIKNVLLKLARGHAAYELAQICADEPEQMWWLPIDTMQQPDIDLFNEFQIVNQVGEIGSRGIQRLYILDAYIQNQDTGEIVKMPIIINKWIEVQKENYRYIAIHESDYIQIKLVIREYLACEVKWYI